MALTTAQLFRRRIADRHLRTAESLTGDGLTSAFQLGGFPIASGTAQSIAGSATVLSPYVTGYSFDYTYGVVTFPSAIPAGSAFGTAVYYFSVFSDEDIDQILSANNNDFDRSELEVIRILMADNYKRAKWAAPGGLSYDESQTMRNLVLRYSALYNMIYNTPHQQASPAPISWAETQADYY